MEAILDFLSEYYIWFFVGAGVLVFALIGFLVQSKKKKKEGEFKGESASVETQTMESTMPPIESVEQPAAPVEEIQPIPETPVEEIQPVDTMPINDIPVEEVPASNSIEKIEFLNEITEPVVPTEPTIEEIQPVHELNSTVMAPTEEPLTYDEPIIPTEPQNIPTDQNNNVQ